VEVISKVERTAVRRSLHRLVRWFRVQSQAVVKNVARNGQCDDQCDNARNRSVEHEREDSLPTRVRKEKDRNAGESATGNCLPEDVD